VSSDHAFRDYHRGRWLRGALMRVVGLSVIFALVSCVWLLAAAAPVAPLLPEAVDVSVDTTPAPQPTVLAALAPPEVLLLIAEPDVRQRSWSIDIDTVGYQAEIDACLWVRMDLGAAAPIVGAHNYCGGSIVLEMAIGDTVTLTGTSLDGIYTVEESRDGRAGENAATVTEGMAVDAILQTCYVNSSGKARLLGLVRVS